MKIVKFDMEIDDTEISTLIAINEEKEILGIANLEYKNKRSAYITRLFVDTKFRREGIGSNIIEECCKISKCDNCETISLIVRKNNNIGIKLYNKLNFIFGYDYENGDILMIRNLKG